MDDQAALLAAIAAHPDEDTPRLAYADWLDDHAAFLPDSDSARIRAEFIRLQCELKKLEDASRSEHDRYIEFYRRQDAILTHHRRELLGPLADDLHGLDVRFDRGFAMELTLDAGRFLAHADAIAALQPLPEIVVWDAARFFERLYYAPHNRLITGLYMSVQETLTERGIGPEGVLDGLADYERWDRLRLLNMAGEQITDEGVRILAESPNFPVLVELDLSGNEMTPAGVRSLVTSPLWPRLTQLTLDANPLDNEGANLLADGPETAIRYLSVRGCGIGTSGRSSLLRRGGWNVTLF